MEDDFLNQKSLLCMLQNLVNFGLHLAEITSCFLVTVCNLVSNVTQGGHQIATAQRYYDTDKFLVVLFH